MNKWQDLLIIGMQQRQLDWGDHPRTGDWVDSWTVFYRSKDTTQVYGGRATKRYYSCERDAKRGAAMIFRSYIKSIEKDLLSG